MLLTFSFAIVAAYMFNWNDPAADGLIQLQQQIPWLQVLSSHYDVGVDGLSMPLVLMACGLGLLVCVASQSIEKQVKGYYALLLVALALTLGAFVAQDLLLFYIFCQLSLVPLYFLISLWGGAGKEFAAGKFVIFMFAGGVVLLLAILGLHGVMFTGPIFWLLLAGFAIMIPVAGLHTWFIDALAEAPTPVAMLLAGVTLNLGGYGLFRFVLPQFPHQVAQYWWWIALGGVVTILYGALCALAQKDLKRLIAYAAMSQMGYVLLGVAVLTPAATQGAFFMLIAHGLSIALLFFIAGIIEQRAQHCAIDRLGGLATQMPGYSSFAAIGFFSAMGIPGFCNFVGILLVIFGSFSAAGIDPSESPLAQTPGHNTQLSVMVFAILAAAASILTAGYLLWAMQRIFLGAPRPEHHHFAPLLRYERIVLFLLCTAAIALGVYPTPLLSHLPQFNHGTPPHIITERN